MDFLEEKLKELAEADLQIEIERELDVCGKKFGEVSRNKDSIINARADKIERIRVKSNNPMVKPGALLGSLEGVKVDDPFGWASGGLKVTAMPIFDNEVECALSLENPPTEAIESLFEFRKGMKRSLLVIDDYIEITRVTTITSGRGAETENTNKSALYSIAHYIGILDGERMYRIPTNTFGSKDNNDSFHAHVLSTTELNMREIMERYKRANLNEVIHPLVCVS